MKTIQDMARESHLDVYGLGQPHKKFMSVLKAFAKLVETPLRLDIKELLQENKLLRARNYRLETQLQQEPMAKHYVDGGHLVYPPAQRKPLTDEQLLKVIKTIDRDEQFIQQALRHLARAIEAAHGITAATQLKE